MTRYYFDSYITYAVNSILTNATWTHEINERILSENLHQSYNEYKR